MNGHYQNNETGMKRSWAERLTGAFASLAIAALVALPSPVNAEESEGTYMVIIGAPGSGKSTVSAYISESKDVPIIEVGQLLREALATASKNTTVGKPGSQRTAANTRRVANIEMAKNQLAAGELVDGLAIDATVGASILSSGAADGYILDGYPGTVAQAEFLDALLAATGVEPIVIYLDVPDEVALARMESRGRVDDEHGFGKKRLEVFRKNMMPLLAFYKDGGLYTVDATKDISEVRAQVDKILSISREISLYYQ